MNSKINSALKTIENGFGDMVYVLTGNRKSADIATLLFTFWFRGAVIPTIAYAIIFSIIK